MRTRTTWVYATGADYGGDGYLAPITLPAAPWEKETNRAGRVHIKARTAAMLDGEVDASRYGCGRERKMAVSGQKNGVSE